MKPETQLLAFEVLKPFCDELRAINDKRLNVVEDSAEYLRKYLDQANADYADYIISAIPFVALPEKLGDSIIQTAFDNLRPGGLFIQLNYSLIPKKRYERFFSKVDVHFVPLNIPPAFVMVCHKAK
jgi:phospholipid N-methyltransferase